MNRADAPEATVDEDHNSLAGEDDVRAPAATEWCEIGAVAETGGVEQPTHLELRGGIAPLVALQDGTYGDAWYPGRVGVLLQRAEGFVEDGLEGLGCGVVEVNALRRRGARLWAAFRIVVEIEVHGAVIIKHFLDVPVNL